MPQISAAARSLRHNAGTRAALAGMTAVAPGADFMRTLKASLLASVIGTGAWLLGLTEKMWPAHPMWAVFFLTIGVMACCMYALPEERQKKIQ